METLGNSSALQNTKEQREKPGQQGWENVPQIYYCVLSKCEQWGSLNINSSINRITLTAQPMSKLLGQGSSIHFQANTTLNTGMAHRGKINVNISVLCHSKSVSWLYLPLGNRNGFHYKEIVAQTPHTSRRVYVYGHTQFGHFHGLLIIMWQKAHFQQRSEAILLNQQRLCYPDLHLNSGKETKWWAVSSGFTHESSPGHNFCEKHPFTVRPSNKPTQPK